MNELKQHGWLLIIILILMVIKFIVVPTIEWQNEVIANIQLLERKQGKVINLLENKSENNIVNEKLTSYTEQGNRLFFSYQQDSIFKLSQQKVLESLLAKHGLIAENIGWQASTKLEELSATRYLIQIRFKGEAINVIDFMLAIESQKQLISIKDFNISVIGQNRDTLGRMNGQISLYLYGNNISSNTSLNQNAGINR